MTGTDIKKIKGSGNTLLGLGKITPQLILKADILSEFKQLLKVVNDPTLILSGDGENEATCENAMKTIQERKFKTLIFS